MSTTHGAALAATLLLGVQTPVQTPVQANRMLARYQVSSDTLRYEIKSPFAVSWIRGADTVRGPSLSGWQLESHGWRGTATRPELIIRSDALDRAVAATVDTFALQPDGRVVLRNGAPPALDDWIDVLPRLPQADVRPGLAWTDTVASIDTTVPHGQLYSNVRRYVVEAIVDTLGTRLLEIAARGRVHIRLPVDSTSWIDVSGSMTERVVFDLLRGRLVVRASSMILSGGGVAPASVDTLPARFESRTVMSLIDPARARLLLERVQRPR